MRIGGQKSMGRAGGTLPAASGRASEPAATGEQRSAAVVASVAGLNPSELSPNVRAALDALMQEVDRLRSELDRSRRRIEHLERLADEDTLLPVLNRRAFVRELSRMISFGERYGLGGAVLFFDVNHLKQINDEHGHAAGDAALRKVAEVLLANVRGSDVVGRLGGDEFGVILAQADQAAAREKAVSLAALIAETEFDCDGKRIPLSVACGHQPLLGVTGPDDALHAADSAMYRQKRADADSSHRDG